MRGIRVGLGMALAVAATAAACAQGGDGALYCTDSCDDAGAGSSGSGSSSGSASGSGSSSGSGGSSGGSGSGSGSSSSGASSTSSGGGHDAGHDAGHLDASVDAGRLDAGFDAVASDSAAIDTGGGGVDASADASGDDGGASDGSDEGGGGDGSLADAPPESSADAGGTDSGAPEVGPTDGDACGTVYLREPFSDNHNGWTLGSNWGIQTTCPNPPAPQKGSPDPVVDHTTGVAGGVAGAYPCGNNPAGTSTAAYLTSPALDTSGAPTLFVGFYRWLDTDDASYMVSTIDVYDGSGWASVYTNPTSSLVTDGAWTWTSLDVTAYANASFRVRFGYRAVSATPYRMASWNVDDLTVSTSACP